MNKCFNALFAMVIVPLLMLLNGCSSEGVFSESSVKLQRIVIVASPIATKGVSQLTLALGNKQPFEAVGHYSDGSSQTFTDLSELDWHSSDKEAARFDLPGTLVAIDQGSVIVSTTKDGITSNTVTVNITAAVVTAIQVTPSPVNLAKGQTEQLIATATYSDGTSADITNRVTWALDNTNIATVAEPTGLLTGVKEGTTLLTAESDGIISNIVTVNVSKAVITDIQVTPSPVTIAKGQTEQLTAMASYSDGSFADITNFVIWETVDTNTATVTLAGLVFGNAVGNTAITAKKDNITSNTVTIAVSDAVITAIQVTPSPVNVAKGQSAQLTATATYSDGTSNDITNFVVWAPNDTSIATVSATGQLSGAKEGMTTLTVEKEGIISNIVTVNVSAALITAIQVTPSPATITKGQFLQLTALATYSDGTFADITSSVTWAPDNTNIATVTPEGLLSGVVVGSTVLTAMKDNIISNTVTVNVSPAVMTAIKVTPESVNVAKGQTEKLTATATYSDGSTADITNLVTWTPDDTSIATVTTSSEPFSGLLSGVQEGTTTLTIKKDNVTSNVVTVNVSPAVITAIKVNPESVSIAKGQTATLIATAMYSDGTSSLITDSVTWAPVDTNIVTVTSTGLLSGVETGSTSLTAIQGSITSNSVSINISAAVITEIQVTPSIIDIAKGLTQQLTAIATYSDGTLSSVTDSVTWMPTNTDIVTVTSEGLLTAIEANNTTITAIKRGVSSNTVNVNVCATLAGVCIDIFDSGHGRLFINSPSTAYLDSIGVSSDLGWFPENGSRGPIGNFSLFDQPIAANTLCRNALNLNKVGGRTNWRLATRYELEDLYKTYGNMFQKRGWPTNRYYWSSTSEGSENYVVGLHNGLTYSRSRNDTDYAACISTP